MKDYIFNNPDLYPTTEDTFNRMIEGIQIEGKVIYDPSAGTGNIVKFCQERGAKQVIATEINEQLCKILQTNCSLVGKDFLQVTSEQISHVDIIVMNPPFSQGAAHITHAYNIAPSGCKIVALCNIETLKNPYSKSREELKTIIETHGSFQDIGDCFSQAERKTGVNVALIRLDKPGSNYEQEFEGFFLDEDPEERQANGLIQHNVIRELVNRYVGAVKIYDQQLETAIRLNEITGEFYDGQLGYQITSKSAPIQRNDFKKGMQKSGWSWIFSKLNLTKHTTRGLREDINKFVETQENVPFTMRNIYKMLEIVHATTGQRMNKAILEVFDKVTQYHDDNRYGLPGWKTNSHYLLTRRFIFPNLAQIGYDGQIDACYSSQNFEMVEDLIKALCYVEGKNYEDYTSIQDCLDYHYFLKDDKGNAILEEYSRRPIKERRQENIIRAQANRPGSVIFELKKEWGKWFETDFFRLRCYKKGTMHFEFKDEKVWSNFNQRVAKLKGYPLPEKKEQTAYQQRQNGHKPAPKQNAPAKKVTVLHTIKLS